MSELTDLLEAARDLLEAEYDADAMSDAQLEAWRAADGALFAALQDCRRYETVDTDDLARGVS